ncbi:hypothetical protein DW979_12365 [Eubacterium sp. AM49-13BH]|nr:hypothetical protein DW979_12365 [Eubacterium sp. AM49-13BH]
MQQPKEYREEGCSYDERKKNYKEKYVADYCELDGAIEDYEKSIEIKLKSIFSIKNKGNIKKAWDELRELTVMVRGSKSKPSKRYRVYIICKHVGILMIMRIVAMHKNISRKLWK